MSKKVKIQIKHYFTGSVLFEYECEDNTISKTVQEAVSKRANLRSANLRSANLSGAYLSGAYLSGAYLRSANLRSANLRSANLSGAYLSGAYLSGAYLRSANLRSANLSGADLSGANLRSADLSGAYLSGANLSGADLRSANLSGAYLRSAKNADLAIAMTRILPEGQLIGYKKCRNGVKVLHIYGATEAVSTYDQTFVYRKGEVVRPDKWNDDWTNECSSGVHFFITREEAEAYV
jgi:hypothetical protein